jgi:uncharacterized protein (TIGR03435 family)
MEGMKSRAVRGLEFSREAVLAVGGVAALAMVILSAPLVRAQSSAGQKRLAFDAASVKPVSVPAGVTVEDGKVGIRKGSGIQIQPNTGGPGTNDPSRIHYPLITLKQLLWRAWDSYYEIEGPGWLDSQAVAVDATMPPDTTKAQFQEMLRNLITEQFGLRRHAGKKEITGYAMVVGGSGPKVKVSADQGEAAWARPAPPTRSGPDGFPVFSPVPGKMMTTERVGDRSRIIAQQITMEALAKTLGSELRTTIADATGLTAKYDFTLTYASLNRSRRPPICPKPSIRRLTFLRLCNRSLD